MNLRLDLYGTQNNYIPIRSTLGCFCLNYNKQECGDYAKWIEILLYKNKYPQLSIYLIKKAIYDDIDWCTELKIRDGFKCIDDELCERTFYLSDKKLITLQHIYNIANTCKDVFPLKIKLTEDEFGDASYKTFKNAEEYILFYTDIVKFICKQLSDGYYKKDNMDWSPYEIAFLNDFK